MIYIVSFAMLYGLVPFLYFLLIKDKISNKINATKPFLILVFLSGIYEFIFTTLLKWDVSNWFVIYSITSFFTIFYFYTTITTGINKLLRVVSFIFFLLLLLILFLSFGKEDFFKISSWIDTYTTVFIFIYSIIWFKKIFQELEYDTLWESPYFYFVSGLILYHFGNLFLFLMIELIYKNDNYLFQYYWLLNIVLLILLRTLLIVGIWKARVK